VIKDFLLPQGLDINHGFAKTPVIKSEVRKKREALEKRSANVARWGEAARVKAHRASTLSTKLWKQTKERSEQLYRALNERIWELEAQGMSSYQLRAESKKLKAEADAELEPLWQRVSRVRETVTGKVPSMNGIVANSGNSYVLWKISQPMNA